MPKSFLRQLLALRLPAVALALAGLLVLAAALLFLPGQFSGETKLQEATAIIDPALVETLRTQAEVEVLISLKNPDLPMAEWMTELRRQNTAERQARVLSVLTESDFTLIHQFEISAALSGVLTESGLGKLATHPDVAGIGVAEAGTWDISETVIDPAVLDALQTQAEVEVFISLKLPDILVAEWRTELQARVLSVLTPSDFILLHQFEFAAALAGRITKSGVQKLAGHPDVAGVGLDTKVFVD